MRLIESKFSVIGGKMILSEGLRYHLDHGLRLHDCLYRPGSEMFLKTICEARMLYKKGMLQLTLEDRELMATDLGEYGVYEGRKVMLDYPIEAEVDSMHEAEYRGRKVKLNKPKRGGSKKFYVYVRNPKTKNVKRVSFGARGMTTGLRDPKRSKSFEKRHRCTQKNDKTKPGYWACRIGRYPKVTGAPYRRWW